MNGNGWFFVGALVGIVVTIVFELLIGFIFGLPSRGVDDVTPSASEVIAAHTSNVRIVPPAEYPHGEVIDLRERTDRPLDAGHATVGHALGVVLVLGALFLLLGLAGAVEGGVW